MRTRWWLSTALATLLASSAANAQVSVTASIAPPAPINETQPPSPGPNFTWIGGFWSFNGSAFTWTAGHWEQPPAQAQGWEAPRWEQEGRTHRLRPGRWRGANNTTVQQTVNLQVPNAIGSTATAAIATPVQTVNVAPPAPLQETQPPSPGANYLWVAGFWSWNGSQFTWTAGRWEAKPTDAESWEQPQWEHDGPRFRFRPGRWRGRNNTTAQPTQAVQVVTSNNLPVATPVQTVNTAPPAAIVEAQPPSPGADFTWVAGYWSWNGTQYAWTAGHWEQRPAQAQAWEAPQWQPEGRGFRFRPGRWRGANNATVQAAQNVQAVSVASTVNVTATVNTAPPAAIAEVQSASPGPNYTWVAGFWSWNGSQYAWNAGHWEQPPVAAASWDAPQWEREGQGYRFRAGRWRARDAAQATAQSTTESTPVVVTVAPPRARAERRSRPTQPGQVWVAGSWTWNGSQYVWTPGRWENPPAPRAQWVGPQWRRQGRSWTMQPGRWR